MNTEVSEYINNAPEQQKEIMQEIRVLIFKSVPNAIEEFKWSRPVYKTEKDFAYLKVSKAYVTLGFNNFHKLNDPENRLEGTGKDMRHLKLKSIKDVDSELFEQWFKAATSV